MNPRNRQAQELETWWVEQARAEFEPTIAKAVDYGSRDLVEIGQDLILGGYGGDGFDASDEALCAEIGIWFYLRGKMARAMEAYRQGRKPSDDTMLDIGVYTRMIQRVRDTGGWPGELGERGVSLLHCGQLVSHGRHDWIEQGNPELLVCPGSPPPNVTTEGLGLGRERNVQGSEQ